MRQCVIDVVHVLNVGKKGTGKKGTEKMGTEKGHRKKGHISEKVRYNVTQHHVITYRFLLTTTMK